MSTSKLARFSALATAFAAGLILTGCANTQTQQYAYTQSPYVNSGPAFVPVQGADGRTYVYPGAQNQGAYANGQPYGAQNPQYPYGYSQQPQRPTNGNVFLSTLAGAAIGNAIKPGDAGSIAAGAVGGQIFARQAADPCADAINPGTILGGVAGYALGSHVGQGDGRKTAQVLGAIMGSNAGNNMTAPGRKPGCR